MAKFFRKKKFLTILVVLVCISIAFISCNRGKKEENKNKDLVMQVEIKDNHSLSILRAIIDEYKKENKDVNIIINSSLGESIMNDGDKQEGDIIFTSRNKMIEMQNKGLLQDVQSYHDKIKLNEKYYKVVSSYGRYLDKSYGISLIPYTLEIAYNKDALKKYNVNPPKTLGEAYEVMKKVNKESIKIPVLVTEDVDVNNVIAALIAGNTSNMYDIDNIYNSSKGKYLEKKEIQNMFNYLDSLAKQGVVTQGTFEMGNKASINKLTEGEIPMLITISYYMKELEKKNIGLVTSYAQSASIKENVPVIVNSLLCIPLKSKNANEVGKFIEFVYGKKMQEKLAKQGFVTGNKEANKVFKENSALVVKHLEESNENSILFMYNLPEKIQKGFSNKVKSVLNKKHTGNEWNQLIEEAG